MAFDTVIQEAIWNLGMVVCDRTPENKYQHKLIWSVPTPGTIKIPEGKRQASHDR